MDLTRVMRKKLATVEPLNTIGFVASVIETRETSHVLVMDKGKLLGIISDRDLLRAIHPNTFSEIATQTDIDVLNKKANQIMTPRPMCIHVDKPIIVAAEKMLENNISALPVMDYDNKVIGIVSLKSILAFFVKRTRDKLK